MCPPMSEDRPRIEPGSSQGPPGRQSRGAKQPYNNHGRQNPPEIKEYTPRRLPGDDRTERENKEGIGGDEGKGEKDERKKELWTEREAYWVIATMKEGKVGSRNRWVDDRNFEGLIVERDR